MLTQLANLERTSSQFDYHMYHSVHRASVIQPDVS